MHNVSIVWKHTSLQIIYLFITMIVCSDVATLTIFKKYLFVLKCQKCLIQINIYISTTHIYFNNIFLFSE